MTSVCDQNLVSVPALFPNQELHRIKMRQKVRKTPEILKISGVLVVRRKGLEPPTY